MERTHLNPVIVNWKDGLMHHICQEEAAILTRLRGSLETVEKSIAEEEKLLRSKEEKLRIVRENLITEEESLRSAAEAKKAENERTIKQIKELRPRKQELITFCRLYGYGFISELKVDYKDKPGKVLCPEGKVCAAKDPADVECNYWDCPGLLKQLDEKRTN